MADNKIIELVEAKAPASTDLALLVAEPSINPSNKKLTLATLFNKIPSWLGLSQTPTTYTSGAIDITSPISFLSVTGTVAFTLAAGAQGQIKSLVCTVAATTAAKAFTVTSSSGLLVTSEAHGLIDTQIIQVTSAGTLPTGLSAGVDYFVRDKTDDTFKLALTSGGTAIAYTNAGSGIHSWTTNPVGTLTPVATANDGYNTITFNTVGQSATLMYSNSGWIVLSQTTHGLVLTPNRVVQGITDTTDVLINQYDGAEVARIHDGATNIVASSGTGASSLAGTAGKGGFGFRRPFYGVTAAADDESITLSLAHSGSIIGVTGAAFDLDIILPAIAAGEEGWFVDIAITTAFSGTNNLEIKTNGDSGDTIYLYGNDAGTSGADVAGGDVVRTQADPVAGTLMKFTCMKGGAAEQWICEAFTPSGDLPSVEAAVA